MSINTKEIETLQKQKNDLLKQVDPLIAKKKKLYSDVDITTPKSSDEKKLDKELADLFSEINALVHKIAKLKKSQNEGRGIMKEANVNWKEFYTMAKDTSGHNPNFEKKYGNLMDRPHIADALKKARDFNSFLRAVKQFESVNEAIAVGKMVKIVDNPYWEAALGKKGPFKRKVKMIAGDNVFFTDGSNSSMKYVKEDTQLTNEADLNWDVVHNVFVKFLKANTKELEKRVLAKDVDATKKAIKSIVSGLTNAQRNLKLESVNEAYDAETLPHLKKVSNEYYVDTPFIQYSNKFGNLAHVGFGDFLLKTSDGEVYFARTSKQLPGFVGRTHTMSGDATTIKKLIASMSSKYELNENVKKSTYNRVARILNNGKLDIY